MASEATGITPQESWEVTTDKSWYAWAVAGAAFFGQLVQVFGLISFGIVISFMAKDFGTAVVSLAIAASVYGVTAKGFGVVWGWLTERIGLRLTQTISALCGGIFLILDGRFATNVWTLTILMGLMGASICGLTTNIAKVVSTWFDTTWRGRGTILVTAGGTVSGMLMGLIAAPLITAYGWRGFLMTLGSIAIVCGIIQFIVVRDKPASIGTVPFGADPQEYKKELVAERLLRDSRGGTGSKDKKEDRAAIMQVLKLPITWKFGVFICLSYLVQTAHSTYLIASVRGAGIMLLAASLAVTVQFATQFCGQIIMPTLTDRFARKTVLGICLVGLGLSYVLFYYALHVGSDIFMLVSVGITGFFNSLTPLTNATLSEMFPLNLRATGPGVVWSISLIGNFFGPLIAGLVITTIGGGATQAFLPYVAIVAVIAGLYSLAVFPKTGGGKRYGDPMAEGAKGSI
ncbi:MAG: nitrate/nitrite transporter [Coriobacteriia bacterium]